MRCKIEGEAIILMDVKLSDRTICIYGRKLSIDAERRRWNEAGGGVVEIAPRPLQELGREIPAMRVARG